MKIAYRSTMPFENRDTRGNPSISPSTNRSVMPFNNIPMITDILNGDVKIRDVYPNAGGSWGNGEDLEGSYRETGDDYKRDVRDMDILNSFLAPTRQEIQKWKVKIPGGSKTFMSFDLAKKYTREKGIPFSYISRIAQTNNSQQDKTHIIADALNKTFLVESIDPTRNVIENGSAFCVGNNYFISCAHVIKSYNKNKYIDQEYFMGTIVNLIHNGLRHEGTVMAVDPKLDIALIGSNFSSDVFEIDESCDMGENIIAIGSPHGYENNVSTGSLGSVDRKLYSYEGAPYYLFVDLSVFPGNSGGPVIKASNGKVIGMITLIVSSSGGYGLNAALPSTYIKDFCNKNVKGFSNISQE